MDGGLLEEGGIVLEPRQDCAPDIPSGEGINEAGGGPPTGPGL